MMLHVLKHPVELIGGEIVQPGSGHNGIKTKRLAGAPIGEPEGPRDITKKQMMRDRRPFAKLVDEWIVASLQADGEMAFIEQGAHQSAAAACEVEGSNASLGRPEAAKGMLQSPGV